MAQLSPTALEAAAVAALVEMDDRGLLKDVGDDLFDEIKNAVATAAITAYLTQAGKEGWVIVPKAPTVAMIEAGCDNNPTSWNEGTDLGFAAVVASDVYRAMLAAAQNGGDLPAPLSGG